MPRLGAVYEAVDHREWAAQGVVTSGEMVFDYARPSSHSRLIRLSVASMPVSPVIFRPVE